MIMLPKYMVQTVEEHLQGEFEDQLKKAKEMNLEQPELIPRWQRERK